MTQGRYSWLKSSDAEIASLRGQRETGGVLMVAGATAWLIHSVLMIAGLVALLSARALGGGQSYLSVIPALGAFAAATFAVLLAAFLFGTGIFVFQGGTIGFAFQDWTSAVSPSTQTKGKKAAILMMLYGTLGILVVGLIIGVLFAPSNSGADVVRASLYAISALWITASIAVVIGGVYTSGFLETLLLEVRGDETMSGAGFLTYTILNAVGTLLIAGPMVALLSNPLPLERVPLLPLLIGAVLEFAVVPIVGIVVFGLLIVNILRLRRLEPGPRVAGLR